RQLPFPPLLVISDRSQSGRPLPEVAAAVFRGGCRWVSLREKDLPARARHALLPAPVTGRHRDDALGTVHDHSDGAVACSAAGVHLPGGSDPAAARRRLPNGLIGVSAHSPEEAAAQLAAGADYATLSPIFLTSSKPGYGPALGRAALTEAAQLTSGP